MVQRSGLSTFLLILFSYLSTIAFSNYVWSQSASQASKARIEVFAREELHRSSRLLTGACIEDVNHEIYGGIYSQMIFGESFQEPPASFPPRGFKAYGGVWRIEGEELSGSAGQGNLLVSDHPPFLDGEVSVELCFDDKKAGNSGLILRLANPGIGADNFDGYEVSLEPHTQVLKLGVHRHDWKFLHDTPCEVKIGDWNHLRVKLNGPSLEVFVNEQRVTSYTDTDRPLLNGTFGVRQWQRDARYRNLHVKIDDRNESLKFLESESAAKGEVSGMWSPIKTEKAVGKWSLDFDRPYHGKQSQRMAFVEGVGEIGIENRGLNRWGMHFEKGKPYEGILWVRSANQSVIHVQLESGDGSQVVATQSINVKQGDWERYVFTLTPNATLSEGRFGIRLKKPSEVEIGYAFLQPGPWGRFSDLPVRRDVAEGLIKQGVTILRQGGLMANHAQFRWKNMIGPRDRRVPVEGFWYPYSSNGWGIIDFMNFCEAAGIEYVPDFNMGETPQDMSDFIQYAKGGPDSEWGKKRIADGHPTPYRLKYIQLGNEERVDEKYAANFESIARAVWKVDSEVILVVGDFVYGEKIQDPNKFSGAASGITNLNGQKRILDLAKECDREVWFDVHVGTDGPLPDSTFDGMFSFRDAIGKIAEGARHQVVTFEFNSGNHTQRRALANAIAINGIERDGGIRIACVANCLQPNGQNDNGWDQGLLFLDPSHVWLQPPGYVTQMYSHDYLPIVVRTEVSQTNKEIDCIAKINEDKKRLTVYVVNPTANRIDTEFSIQGFVPSIDQATITELAGEFDSQNTASDPESVAPRERPWRHGLNESTNTAAIRLKPYSVTVIRF